VEPSPQTWATLHDEVGRLRRLADDLQELSRAEARQIPLTPRPIPPAAIIRAALDRLEGQFAEKGLEVECLVPATLPPVLADQNRAVQVVTNLLTNALRYTPAPGRVAVAAERRGDTVAITVTDSGVGLAPAHLAHLFRAILPRRPIAQPGARRHRDRAHHRQSVGGGDGRADPGRERRAGSWQRFHHHLTPGAPLVPVAPYILTTS